MSGLKVVAVRRDAEGRMNKFKLSDDRELTVEECKNLINEGKLDLIVGRGRSGGTVIRSRPDSPERLTNLPNF